MSADSLLIYTQLGPLIAYGATVLGLYKLLGDKKDAEIKVKEADLRVKDSEISLLKQRVAALDVVVGQLKDQTYDVVVERIQKLRAASAAEMKVYEEEKAKDKEEIDRLKQQVAASQNMESRAAALDALVAATTRAADREANTQDRLFKQILLRSSKGMMRSILSDSYQRSLRDRPFAHTEGSKRDASQPAMPPQGESPQGSAILQSTDHGVTPPGGEPS